MSRTLLAVATVLSLASPAEAGFLGRLAALRLPTPASITEETGVQTTPLGYPAFCATYSSPCDTDGARERVQLTPEIWQAIRQVDAELNHGIAPDVSQGVSSWPLDVTKVQL